MRRTKRLNTIIGLTLMVVLAAQIRVAGVVAAEATSAPSLVISQLKITSSNGQFITLYNATDTPLDMGKYQLEYFNNYDLTKATSSKLISLTGTVPPHGYYVVSDDSFLLCYQQTVDSVSLDFSSTAGLVEVLVYSQTTPGSSATPVLQDFVGWSKTAGAGAQTLPTNTSAFLERQPVDAANNPVVNSPGTGSWQAVQPGSTPCSLVTAVGSSPVQTGANQLLPGVEPAATVIPQAVIGDGSVAPTLPAGDVGLMSPSITEILPNPAGTGNDSTDEFIELYNPNPTTFDLTGFILQAGTTSLHNFTFPSGITLPAQSFAAFYSSQTGLSLSNTAGQVALLDPMGNQISATDPYAKAEDGQAWALANGQWRWTTNLTPGAPNVIVQPPLKAKKTASSKAKSSKSSSNKAKLANSKSASASSDDDSTPATTPIHTSALAVVAGLALLYGVYEYRADLANRFYQLRRNFKTGSGDGS